MMISEDEDDLDAIRMDDRYNKLLKVYRVLPPDYVDDMIKDKEEKSQKLKELKEA